MMVSAGTVRSLVTDPKLVGERREQIVREAGISVGLVYRYGKGRAAAQTMPSP